MLVSILFLIKGTHNAAGELNYEDYKLEEFEDAVLTPLGISQAKCLSEKAQITRKAKLLVVSPMRRTIQTAMYSFPCHIHEMPWVAIEEVICTIRITILISKFMQRNDMCISCESRLVCILVTGGGR